MPLFADYIDSRFIQFLTPEKRDEVITALVESPSRLELIPSKESFIAAVLEREEIVSTGIGMGVAIPHAKLHNIESFFISVGILSQGIDWKAMDGRPVRLVFLIGGPINKQSEYLKILSSLTMCIKEENVRKNLLNSTTKEEVVIALKE